MACSHEGGKAAPASPGSSKLSFRAGSGASTTAQPQEAIEYVGCGTERTPLLYQYCYTSTNFSVKSIDIMEKARRLKVSQFLDKFAVEGEPGLTNAQLMLANHDLKPVEPERRQWRSRNFSLASLEPSGHGVYLVRSAELDRRDLRVSHDSKYLAFLGRLRSGREQKQYACFVRYEYSRLRFVLYILVMQSALFMVSSAQDPTPVHRQGIRGTGSKHRFLHMGDRQSKWDGSSRS